MTFVELCVRWKVSPYSSHNMLYDTMNENHIIDDSRDGKMRNRSLKPYTVNELNLAKYEQKVGFKPTMLTKEEYREKYHKSYSEIRTGIKNDSIKYCILAESKTKVAYRLEDKNF